MATRGRVWTSPVQGLHAAATLPYARSVLSAVPYPRLASYLDGLPHGLSSFPQCETRAVVTRTMLRELQPRHLEVLPPALRHVVQSPPLPTMWLPSAVNMASQLLIADELGLDDVGYEAWSYDANRRLYGRTLSWMLTAFASPHALIRRSSWQWRLFHRGTSLAVGLEEWGRARIFLTSPRALIPPLALRGFAAALRGAVEMTGAEVVSMEIADATPGRAEFVLHWRDR